MQICIFLSFGGGHLLRKIFKLTLPSTEIGKHAEQLFVQGILRQEISHLGQVADTDVPLARNSSLVRLFTTGQNIQER